VVEVQEDLVSQAQGSIPGMAKSFGRNVDGLINHKAVKPQGPV
jgi:hypothetical protein